MIGARGIHSPAMNSLRLVQLHHPNGRFIARVDEPKLTLLTRHHTIYDLAMTAISEQKWLVDLVRGEATGESLDYDAIYNGKSDWKLLRPFDHPQTASRCFVTGTGLTHKARAQNRQSMHVQKETIETDSLKMFRI